MLKHSWIAIVDPINFNYVIHIILTEEYFLPRIQSKQMVKYDDIYRLLIRIIIIILIFFSLYKFFGLIEYHLLISVHYWEVEFFFHVTTKLEKHKQKKKGERKNYVFGNNSHMVKSHKNVFVYYMYYTFPKCLWEKGFIVRIRDEMHWR